MRQPCFAPASPCPARRAHMLASAPTAVPSAQEAAARLPAAREVIDRHVREIGGREAVLAQSSTHVVGTVSLPAAGISGEMEAFHAKPNKFLQRLVLPGIGTVEEGFDGTVAWSMSAPDRPGAARRQAARAAPVRRRLLRRAEARRALRVDDDGREDDVRGAARLQDQAGDEGRRRGLRVLRHGNRPQDRRRDDARVADGAGAEHDRRTATTSSSARCCSRRR